MQCIEEGLGSVKEEIQPLSKKEQMEEFMFLGLRLTTGVGKKAFSGNVWYPYGRSIWSGDWEIRRTGAFGRRGESEPDAIRAGYQ